MSSLIPGSVYFMVFRAEIPETVSLRRGKADELMLFPIPGRPELFLESLSYDFDATRTVYGYAFPQLGKQVEVKATVRARAFFNTVETVIATRRLIESAGITPLTLVREADITTSADRANISPGAVFLEESFGFLVDAAEDLGEAAKEGLIGSFKGLPLLIAGAVAFAIYLNSK